MPMNARLLRPTTGFSPASIPGLALWLDAAASDALFQNSDGTTPAVAPGDPVGFWRDRSGNNRHATQATAGSRPRVASAAVNGKRVAEWHSSTSKMSIATNLVVNSSMTVFFVFKRGPANFGGGGGGGYGSVLNTSATTAGPQLRVDNGVLHLLGGTNLSSFTPGGAVGVTNHAILTGVIDNLGTSLFANAALVDSDAAAGSAATQGSETAIGVFNAATNAGGPLNAEIAELITYNRVLNPAQRRKVEVYLARRWSITLAPQVANADAQDWINRVYANGGTVSTSTAAAVDTFCNAIESAGIRSKFLRMNLFCGNSDASLNAVRTPLYRGASLGGTQLGDALDTNNNFVAGDYAETGASGGLKGNGTTKHLGTGFNVDLVAASDSHMSVGLITAESGSGFKSLMGANISLDSWELYARRDAGSGIAAACFGAALTESNRFGDDVVAATLAVGHIIASYPAMYRNGTASGTTATANGAVGAKAITVFAQNGASVGSFTNARLSSYSLGLALNSSQAAAFSTAHAAFNTALGRP